MNMEVRQSDIRSNSKLKIVDVDIHPKSAIEDLKPYLSQRWWEHLTTYGQRTRQGYLKGFPYPKMQPQASRRDSWPPDGGLPASNLSFMVHPDYQYTPRLVTAMDVLKHLHLFLSFAAGAT